MPDGLRLDGSFVSTEWSHILPDQTMLEKCSSRVRTPSLFSSRSARVSASTGRESSSVARLPLRASLRLILPKPACTLSETGSPASRLAPSPLSTTLLRVLSEPRKLSDPPRLMTPVCRTCERLSLNSSVDEMKIKMYKKKKSQP